MSGRDPRSTALARTVALGLLVVLTGLKLRAALRFGTAGLAAIGYPFELDFGEGAVLNQTKRLMAGQMYPAIGPDPPCVVTNYPPLFHVVTVLLARRGGDVLALGRTLSLASTLVAAAIIAALVWRAVRADVGRLPRGLAALFGGLSFLSVSYTATWAALMRVDMLAIALTLAGLLLFVVGTGRGWRAYWCALPFVLAVYTKQTAIAAPAACLIVGLVLARAFTLRLGALLLAAGLAIFAVVDLFTGGWFHFHLISGNYHPYDWHRAAAFLWDLKQRQSIELAVALVASVSLLGRQQEARANTPTRAAMSASTDINWARPVLGVYLFMALLTSLAAGKVGSEVNHLIELMGVVCACVAIALAEGFSGVATRSPASRPVATALSVLVLPLLLLISGSGLIWHPGIEWIELPSSDDQQDAAWLLEIVRQAEGPVLSGDLTLLEEAGKPVEFQPFDMVQLADRGRWDDTGLVTRIADQRYALIVVHVSLNDPRMFGAFTPRMIAAMQDRYTLAAAISNYWIYQPRTDTVDSSPLSSRGAGVAQ